MDLAAVIFGHHAGEGLVAVEPAADGRTMTLYLRRDGRTVREEEPFTPFLPVADAALLADCPAPPAATRALSGPGCVRCLATFASWADWQKAVAWLAKTTRRVAGAPDAPFLAVTDPVQQHLLWTGRTLFKGLRFEQLRRLQVDIETYTDPGFEFCNADRASDRILVIAVSDTDGFEEILHERDERRLLERFVACVRARDPDVLEGHNIFKFDWPYIETRARRHGVALALGRDASLLRSHPSRFTVGERMVSFPKYEIAGRHILDTFLLLQAYDITHRSLDGFGLKEAARHFHLAAPDREYIEGAEIARVWTRDPERVLRYAAHDVREARGLSDLLARTYFVQAQMLPYSFHTVCLRGNAAKIDALLLRAYLRAGHALPAPDQPREFEGGYTAIFQTGVIRPVHHCDVRSLYPSLMLAHKLAPASDALGVFLPLLEFLRARRLDAKRQQQTARDPAARAHCDALQTALKVLINSFYGYLGFSQARFSDFRAAERVTAEGRALVQAMVAWLGAHGAQPVECDTDGIYYVPPSAPVATREQEAFRLALQASLPAGIEVEFDGDYVAMFSYKRKNYALLDAEGAVIVKGAALKSRGLEPYLRAFLREFLRLRLEGRDADLPALKDRYAQAIRDGTLGIHALAKTETLKDAPATYAAKIAKGGRGRNAAYELALRSGRPYEAGDQVAYYITGAKKSVAAHQAAKRVPDWNPAARDENVAYYRAKLDALYARLQSAGGEEDDDETENES